ncbi:MAG: internal scaffolding protein [Microviridae sp.]|nr:MAG: internal scaffolding protein [Microviridae sp.]
MKQAKRYAEQDRKNLMEVKFEKRYASDLDCQAAKNHSDLEIASQNQGAVQAGANELEISYIMEKYQKTGILPDMIKADPVYGDFTGAKTYQEAFEIVHMAQEQFAALDAHIRKRFENDPEQFLAFCNDESNKDEMQKMGLLKEKEQAPTKAAPAEKQVENKQ